MLHLGRMRRRSITDGRITLICASGAAGWAYRYGAAPMGRASIFITPLDSPLSHNALYVGALRAHWRGTMPTYRLNAGLKRLRASGRRDAIVLQHMSTLGALLRQSGAPSLAQGRHSERQTMTLTRIAPGPRMSQAVTYNGILWLSGQIGTASDDLEGQTRACLSQIEALLKAGGSDKAHIIKIEIWLADLGDFDEMNRIYEAWLDPENPPARATCEATVRRDGTLIEIVATAAVI
ncbi:RidA family protein [Roseovarius nanhaiticus]|uniref:RidA family protein n=1 Tax=Roseovarius nanhaiticus TaxID=573024 RepID=UPI002492A268|nr:RidA family protein [Roseovarius nanhaiticus]